MKQEKRNEAIRIASALGILGFVSWGFFSLIILSQGNCYLTLKGIIIYIIGLSSMILINFLATEKYESE